MKVERLRSSQPEQVRIPWGPFAWATGIWLAIAAPLSGSGWTWFLAFWAVCTLDLAATAQLFASVFLLISGHQQPKNRTRSAIRASSWGSIKLVSWGLIATQLLSGRSIPTPALLLGLGTLFVVPLIGGVIWYRQSGRILTD